MSYQTYIPDEWREERKREQEEAAKVEAAHRVGKQRRVAKWKDALYATGKVVGWLAVSLMALLVVTVGFLVITGARRR